MISNVIYSAPGASELFFRTALQTDANGCLIIKLRFRKQAGSLI